MSNHEMQYTSDLLSLTLAKTARAATIFDHTLQRQG